MTVPSAVMQHTGAAASGPTLTVTFDSAPQVGSLLVLIANSPQGIGTPAGWTLRASFAGDQGFYIWDKVSAGAADTASTVIPNSAAPVAVSKLELNAVDVTGFDVHSAVNGATAANNVPISGVNTTGVNGAALLAVGALHGWASGVPDPVPSYVGSASWTHLGTAAMPGSGPTLVGHYLGEAAQASAGAAGTVIIANGTVFDNTAGFLLAYHRTAPLVIVPITAVNSYTDWTLAGETDATRALSDAVDTSRLTSVDLHGGTALIDVTLGSMEKPPAEFVCRVRGNRDAVSASLTGRLYDGDTLLSTSTQATPPLGALSNLLLTFPAGDLTATTTAQWRAGLRLTVTATAA